MAASVVLAACDARAARKLAHDETARYLSRTPLFDPEQGVQPLPDGAYFSGGGEIVLRRQDRHYAISGDAIPNMVTLIAIVSHADAYIFQQSDGLRTAYYGVLRVIGGAAECALFSPESVHDRAIATAVRRGAVAGQFGCVFADQASLLAALVPLAFDARPSAWNRYKRSLPMY